VLLEELDTGEAVCEEVQRLGGEQRSHLESNEDSAEFTADNVRLMRRNTEGEFAQCLWRSIKRHKRAEHTAANVASLCGVRDLLRSVSIHKLQRVVPERQGVNARNDEWRRTRRRTEKPIAPKRER
jgi:hypothetical protein